MDAVSQPRFSKGSPGRLPPAVIGVGVDGSPGGRDAVRLASILADSTGAWLMLICAAFEPLGDKALTGGENSDVYRRHAWAMLTETRDSFAPGAQIEVRSDAFVWRALRHVVHFKHVDLLVVGSSHHAPEGSVGVGKHVVDLQEHLECPLAIAPRGFADRANPRLERVGVGLDGSPESEAAVRLAASIASPAGATLRVRNVIPEELPVAPMGQETLARRVASLSELTPVAAEVDVTPGETSGRLLEMCADVNLLAIGSSRDAEHGRVLLGAAGRALGDAATCPIVVAPRPLIGVS